jgi:O-succinylhomoserine sulfhydrylase
MADTESNKPGFATRAIRAGQVRTPEGEQSEPIYSTSSYVFESAAQAAARFSGAEPGNIYSRFTNPTVRTFEQRLASLEGGERCVATSSGMVAILSTCLALLKGGDHIVSSRGVFGSTTLLFQNYLGKLGIETSGVPLTDLDAWRAAIRPETRILFLETPSNPLTEVADLRALAELAHAHGCLLVVDNTLCTAALQRPLELGADISIVSSTKYIDGQGRFVGGAVIGSDELVGKDVYGFLRTCGPAMSPVTAWAHLKGLETLPLRMKGHCANAQALAEWLQAQELVEQVYYPGLSAHPQHDLAARQQDGFGGLLSFEIRGGQTQAWQFIDALRLISITANLGDTRTMVTHPATTTHGRISPEARVEAGIRDNLVRLAVGLEELGDIQRDLQRGFDAVT